MVYNSFDAYAAQRMMCGLSENPRQFGSDPFAVLYRACLDARRGDDGGGRCWMDRSQTPF
nr:hypothetical protein [Mycobacterium sp.]